MQKVVTGTAAPTDTLYIARESASSIPTRAQSTGVLGWTHTRELHRLSNEIGQEHSWNLTDIQDSPTELSSSLRRSSILGVHKSSTITTRPNLTENSKFSAESNRSTERHMSASTNGHHWRFNATGQLVDSGATADWELTQDIAKLKLSSVGDLADEVRGHMKTPPHAKLPTAGVVQYHEASPLETASEASIDSSPQHSDHQISPSHSRVSSTDTLDSHESVLSSASHTLQGPPHLKIATSNEAKERPHSFSGGLSTADLRRLKQVGEDSAGDTQPGGNTLPSHQWSSSHYRDLLGASDKPFAADQPTYPTLAGAGSFARGQQQYDYRALQGPAGGDLQSDYQAAQRGFFPPTQGIPGTPQHFIQGRPADSTPATYRQPQRGFPPQLLPSPTSIGYAAGHIPHLSLGTAQQLYDMMVPHPDSHHPAVSRVQQQHNAFRATHQHSASDPSALRDAATLALLNNQAFAPAAHLYPAAVAPPTMGLYTNQFYAPPDGYSADVAAAASRLQGQFSGPYATIPNQVIGLTSSGSSNAGSQNGSGPSANNRKLGLYKTELCRSWEEKGSCRYGAKCQFAHGEEELRTVSRHPKYKTEICRTFWVSGACPYGKRCCFIHTELPVSGVAPGADGIPPPSATSGGRERSNSDPNDSSVSLLQRIQRKNEATPVDVSPPSSAFFSSRPPIGSLRVDTSALNNVAKQNKSAYPTFASNALMLTNPDQSSVKSPVPLTAGPDLGRHTNTRLDIVGYNQRLNKASSSNLSARHSFNGTDVDLDFTTPSTPSAPNQASSFAMSSNERATGNNTVPRSHVRSGSAGNWGNITRSSNLTAAPAYPQSSEAGDATWSTSELALGSARLTDGWM